MTHTRRRPANSGLYRKESNPKVNLNFSFPLSGFFIAWVLAYVTKTFYSHPSLSLPKPTQFSPLWNLFQIFLTSYQNGERYTLGEKAADWLTGNICQIALLISLFNISQDKNEMKSKCFKKIHIHIFFQPLNRRHPLCTQRICATINFPNT